MKKIPLLIKTFLIFSIFSSVPFAAIAQNAYPAANFLLDYAKSLYQRGDFVNARHEFRALLVIDPNNAVARQYLKKMGLLALPEDSVYSQNVKLRRQNADLDAALNKSREEAIGKSRRITELKQEIEEKQERLRAMDNLAAAKDEAVVNLHEELRLQRRTGELRLFIRESQLEAALSNLQRLKAQIDEYREKVHGLEGDIESLRQSSQTELDIKERQLQQKHDNIKDLIREFDILWQRLIRTEKDNTAKQMRLTQLLGESDSLRASLQEKEIEAAVLKKGIKEQKEELEKELLKRERKIAEQNQKITGDSDAINELNNKTASLLGQLNLSEKEIQETQWQMALITQQLAQIKNENSDKERQIRQIKALLEEVNRSQQADFQKRMDEARDLLQGQKMEITGLNNELELQREAADKRLMEKELELAARYTGIEELNLRLIQGNLQLEQAEKENLDKDLWIEQLNSAIKQLKEASSDQLTKYLQKLNLLEDSLKRKEEEAADSSAKSSEIERLNIKINECQKKAVILENALKVKDSELAELNKKLDSRSRKR